MTFILVKEAQQWIIGQFRPNTHKTATIFLNSFCKIKGFGNLLVASTGLICVGGKVFLRDIAIKSTWVEKIYLAVEYLYLHIRWTLIITVYNCIQQQLPDCCQRIFGNFCPSGASRSNIEFERKLKMAHNYAHCLVNHLKQSSTDHFVVNNHRRCLKAPDMHIIVRVIGGKQQIRRIGWHTILNHS